MSVSSLTLYVTCPECEFVHRRAARRTNPAGGPYLTGKNERCARCRALLPVVAARVHVYVITEGGAVEQRT